MTLFLSELVIPNIFELLTIYLCSCALPDVHPKIGMESQGEASGQKIDRRIWLLVSTELIQQLNEEKQTPWSQFCREKFRSQPLPKP